ncbi:hypothetical protein FA15DRAFT_695849 [Coprinopsis marcescibilis]|uniref:Cupredoxin n=1 Tax=Coprinopsis marcescibilis TaxID=230819 RepID=A0A5C3KR37_COPMA|nr:hypothetical protein FA15DRAFT_695849 [Coprinopsis marcescibilis]
MIQAVLSVLAIAAALPTAFSHKVHEVQVGPNGQFRYDPPQIWAHPHETVRFIFNPKNHTVTQSAFDPPCVGLEGGFRTGFIPVPSAEDKVSIDFKVPENGGKPLWFYCGQTGHCGDGMVFAINAPGAPSEFSFEAHQALAIARNGTGATQPAPVAPTTQHHWTKTIDWHHSYPTKQNYAPNFHHVIVGSNNELTYSPAKTRARRGDTVRFEFVTKNHTVTQSSFENPCQPLVKADGTRGAASGFRPVVAGAPNPTFDLIVEDDTKPIWGYCGQTGHCEAGMVFSINADEHGAASFEAFQKRAKASGGNKANARTGNTDTAAQPLSNSAAGVAPGVGVVVAVVAAMFAGAF